MLESRSPQLLDEGGELRIAWSKYSPAQSFCAKDIASPLKNYRCDAKKIGRAENFSQVG